MNADLDNIREAIAREDYEQALAQWNDFTGRMEEAIRKGTLGGDRMQEIGETVEWSRTVLRSAQAHLQSRLDSLRAAALYLAGSGSRTAERVRRRVG